MDCNNTIALSNQKETLISNSTELELADRAKIS